MNSGALRYKAMRSSRTHRSFFNKKGTTRDVRQKVRQVTKVIATLVALVLVWMATPALPAQALTLPHLQFPAVGLAPGMTYPTHLISQTDGGVTVGCGVQNPRVAFETLGDTVNTLQSVLVSATDPRLTGLCNNASAVGDDGTVFTAAFYTNNDWERVVAY